MVSLLVKYKCMVGIGLCAEMKVCVLSLVIVLIFLVYFQCFCDWAGVLCVCCVCGVVQECA